jgi:hypothetical protein
VAGLAAIAQRLTSSWRDLLAAIAPDAADHSKLRKCEFTVFVYPHEVNAIAKRLDFVKPRLRIQRLGLTTDDI